MDKYVFKFRFSYLDEDEEYKETDITVIESDIHEAEHAADEQFENMREIYDFYTYLHTELIDVYDAV